MDEIIDLIAHVPLFASLPSTELGRLAGEMSQIAVSAGTTLFHEGDVGNHFYILISGNLDVLKAIDTTDERLIEIRRPGEMIGEMALLNPDGLRSASVRARTDARLLELSREGFNTLLSRQPLLAYEMVRIMSTRLKEANDATIHDMQAKNRQLQQAYDDLKTAQAGLVEKERLERELEVGYEIQMSLLPKQMPALAGYSFGARLSPARKVGGDLYDVIPLASGKMGILIGDVTDKGVPAAIFMAQAHALLHADASRTSSPREVLQSVNRQLLMMNANELFVTVIYGVLDGATGEFTFARAGHEIPLLRNANGELIAIARQDAMPLGLWDDAILDEQTVILPPGSSLLLYTDGVTDARNRAGEFFGLQNLYTLMRASATRDAQDLCDKVMGHLKAYCGGGVPDDDITLVAVHAGSR